MSIILSLGACQTLKISLPSGLSVAIEQEITDYLDTHLINQVKFQGRPIMIVKFVNGQIASDMDPLTANIRQQMESYLLQQQGIQLYRSFQDLSGMNETSQSELCLKRPELFLGIELKNSGTEHVLSLRMLDKQQGNRWLDGFSFSKHLKLNGEEVSQLDKLDFDPWLKGFRESPYHINEVDLLVKDLGQQIKCQFMKQSIIQSIALDKSQLPNTASFENIISLLNSDLPIYIDVPIRSAKQAKKKSQHLGLAMSWVMLNKQKGWGRLTLSAAETSSGSLVNISARVYITGLNQKDNMPVAATTRIEKKTAEPVNYSIPIIRSVHIEVPNDLNLCLSENPWLYGMQQFSNERTILPKNACFRLNINLFHSSYLFVMSHSNSHRWNRLFPVSCLNRIQLPELNHKDQKFIPDLMDSVQTLKMGGPTGNEKLFVFAIKNKHQARMFGSYIKKIPDACTGEQSIAPGYQNNLLENFKRIAPDGDVKTLQLKRI